MEQRHSMASMDETARMEMTRGRRMGWTLCGLALVAGLTWWTGSTSFYFFDSSIGLSSGWMIFNGWVPFRDYHTPLMPLSSLLVALSYAMFGVRVLSTVITSMLIAMATFLVALRLSRRLVPFQQGFLAVLAATLTTVPSFGVLFYNSILSALLLIYALLALVLIRREDGQASVALRLWIGVVLALATVTKLHFGIFVALQGLLELALYRLVGATLRQLVWRLVMIVGPVLLGCLAVLAWVGFDLGLLLHNIAVSDASKQSVAITANIIVLAGLPSQMNDPPVFGRIFFVLVLIGAGQLWRRDGMSLRHLLPLGFALGLIAVEQLVALPSAEVQATHLFVYAVAILALLQTAPPAARPLLGTIAMPLLVCMVVYATAYDVRVLRKSWSDLYHTEITLPLLSRHADTPFFAGVTLQPEHLPVIDGVAALRRRYPRARMLFGPNMEAFYPAFGLLPPKGFPNWFHPSVSYDAKAVPDIRARFLGGGYDLVLLADARDPILLTVMARRYRPCARMGGWTTLYCSRDFLAHLPMRRR